MGGYRYSNKIFLLTRRTKAIGKAQFRRANPLPYKQPYTIVEGIKGVGHYVGTALGWGMNNNGWWGEGEIKFYIDGDKDFPTICGTGTEDYFGGAYNWDVDGQYVSYSTPFMGMQQVTIPDGLYQAQQRFSMYRWHIGIKLCQHHRSQHYRTRTIWKLYNQRKWSGAWLAPDHKF